MLRPCSRSSPGRFSKISRLPEKYSPRSSCWKFGKESTDRSRSGFSLQSTSGSPVTTHLDSNRASGGSRRSACPRTCSIEPLASLPVARRTRLVFPPRVCLPVSTLRRRGEPSCSEPRLELLRARIPERDLGPPPRAAPEIIGTSGLCLRHFSAVTFILLPVSAAGLPEKPPVGTSETSDTYSTRTIRVCSG